MNNFRALDPDAETTAALDGEIDIDQEALNFYRRTKGDMAERLAEGISMEPVPHFRTDERGRCVFLNQENLCDLYLNLGEETLCEICTNHPRFFHDCGGIQEKGLGIACEEAARLILNRTGMVRFLDYGPSSCDEIVSFLLSVRENMINILQNRSIKIEKEWHRFLNMDGRHSSG